MQCFNSPFSHISYVKSSNANNFSVFGCLVASDNQKKNPKNQS